MSEMGEAWNSEIGEQLEDEEKLVRVRIKKKKIKSCSDVKESILRICQCYQMLQRWPAAQGHWI